MPDGSSDQRHPEIIEQLLVGCDTLDRELELIDHEVTFLYLLVSAMRHNLERLAP